MDGQPFFVVNQVVDPGMIKVIEADILPRLDKDVPNQPSEATLLEKPLLHRYTLVFDREGYSPAFLGRLKAQRIAGMTYHKFPGNDWAVSEFKPCLVEMKDGQQTTLKLAERGSCLSNHLWVREIRKLTDRGHQTAIICTDYQSKATLIALTMFARWSQENFFKYTREHYNLDRLVDYRTEVISDPISLVNPAYRQLDGQVRSCTGKLTRRLAEFGEMTLKENDDNEAIEAFVVKKAACRDDIEQLQHQCQALKDKRKQTAHHITVAELPEEDRFKQLSTPGKHLADTIKMIAYRAETAMANILLRQTLSHPDESRTLLEALFQTEADIIPDEEAGTLTVSVHHLANRSSDAAIEKLCEELNETQTIYPGTKLRLILKLGSR